MDQFQDHQHVWLRSRVHGTYLRADKNGRGVSLRRRRMSMNAAWVVHLYGDDRHVLLRSAAYGRYLSATVASTPPGCRGFRVAQRNYDKLEQEAIRWQPVSVGLGEEIWLRRVDQAQGDGYLRANGRRLSWNDDVVSVDYFYNISTMMQWLVVPIPSTERIPRLPRPPRLNLSFLLLPRVIMGNGEGCYRNNASFPFRGWFVFDLRNELITRLGFIPNVSHNLVMYVRAGAYGRLTPLVVNLPRSRQTIVILITAGAPDNGYPDFDADRERPEQVF